MHGTTVKNKRQLCLDWQYYTFAYLFICLFIYRSMDGLKRSAI